MENQSCIVGVDGVAPGSNPEYDLKWVPYEMDGDTCYKAQGTGGFSFDVRPSQTLRHKWVLTTYWPTFASHEPDMPSPEAAKRCARAKHAGIINAIVRNPVRAQLAEAIRALTKYVGSTGMSQRLTSPVTLIKVEAALESFDKLSLYPVPDMSDVNPGIYDES